MKLNDKKKKKFFFGDFRLSQNIVQSGCTERYVVFSFFSTKTNTSLEITSLQNGQNFPTSHNFPKYLFRDVLLCGDTCIVDKSVTKQKK